MTAPNEPIVLTAPPSEQIYICSWSISSFFSFCVEHDLTAEISCCSQRGNVFVYSSHVVGGRWIFIFVIVGIPLVLMTSSLCVPSTGTVSEGRVSVVVSYVGSNSLTHCWICVHRLEFLLKLWIWCSFACFLNNWFQLGDYWYSHFFLSHSDCCVHGPSSCCSAKFFVLIDTFLPCWRYISDKVRLQHRKLIEPIFVCLVHSWFVYWTWLPVQLSLEMFWPSTVHISDNLYTLIHNLTLLKRFVSVVVRFSLLTSSIRNVSSFHSVCGSALVIEGICIVPFSVFRKVRTDENHVSPVYFIFVLVFWSSG